jgi:hypothetical protein
MTKQPGLVRHRVRLAASARVAEGIAVDDAQRRPVQIEDL